MKDDTNNDDESNRAKIIADFEKMAAGFTSEHVDQMFSKADPTALSLEENPFAKLEQDITDNIEKTTPAEEEPEEESQEEEEEDDTEEEEENSEEEVEEPEEELKPKKNKEDPISASKHKRAILHLQAQKREIERQAQSILDENNYLKDQIKAASQAGNHYYKKAIELELKNAQDEYKAAVKNEDVERLVAAHTRLNEVQHNLRDIENSQYNYSAPAPTPRYNEVEPEAPTVSLTPRQQRRAELIIEENPEINPKSRHYNEKLALKLEDYVEKKNQQLIAEQNMHEYGSSEYFDDLEDYITTQKSRYIKSTKEARPAVGGVRSVTAATGTTTGRKINVNNIVLSQLEKDWARAGGISEELILKEKRAQAQEIRR